MENNIPFGYNDNGISTEQKSFVATKTSMQNAVERSAEDFEEKRQWNELLREFPFHPWEK